MVEQFERTSRLDRRAFLHRVILGGAAAYTLQACGKGGDLLVVRSSLPDSSTSSSLLETSATTAPTTTHELILNEPAIVSPDARAQRGEQVQVTDTQPPPPRPQTWDAGDFINYVLLPPELRAFAFTLDDGPSPYNTDSILRTLDRYGIKATFFLVGVNVRAWPEIARRIRDAGHEIGNHSVYHTPYVAISLAGQIAMNQQIIFEETGVVPVAHRAPGLTRGDIILQTLRNLNMYEVHTTLNQNDWRDPRWSAYDIIQELEREIRSGGFSLNHDGGGPRPTADAWPGLLDVAVKAGYTCLKATEMINLGSPMPGHMSYSARLTESQHVPQNHQSAELTTDFCNYDPVVELERRLKDGPKRAERSRIVEVLADIQQMQKQQ